MRHLALALAFAIAGCSGLLGIEPLTNAGDAQMSTVSVDRTTGIVANGVDHATITVTVRDAGSHPVAGVTVTVDAGSAAGAMLTQPASVTSASGVATATIAATRPGPITITATIENAGKATPIVQQATVTFQDIAPTGLAYSTNPATYPVGNAIAPNTPTSGGGAVVSYTVAPALPAGLALDPVTGIITGTPTAVTAAATYTVTAINTGGNTSVDLSITIADAAPTNLTYSTNPAVYTKGTAIAANTPSSTGGAVVSYSVSPALPAGLVLNTSTGAITGTPTAITAIATYTVTATNATGNTNVGVSITVNDAPPASLSYSTNPAVYTKGSAIAANSPSSSGGAVVSYAVAPALPTGLSLDTNTGIITGTPTVLAASATYTVTATNTGGNAQVGVMITVKDVPPSNLTYSVNPATYTKGSPITANTPSSAGGPVVMYSVSPTLPAGLSLDMTTGIISGTPTAIAATASYTVTATNSGGFTTKALSITVNDVAPTNLTYSTNPALYAKGTPITANTPSSSGGAVVSYGVAPALPAGLSLDTSTGVISGTPTAATATASYTVTATNSGGSTQAGVSITVTTAAFASKSDFATGAKPDSIAIGDFNGDGVPDLVTSNFNDGTVSVLLGTTMAGAATATFAAKTDLSAGSGPSTPAVADFNGDGRPDIAVVANSAGTVGVLLNTTAAGATSVTFATRSDFALVASSTPTNLAVGDFNGDGKPDLAVANFGVASVSVLLDTTAPGATTATFATHVEFTTGASPNAVSVGDFNGDGKLDLAVPDNSANLVSVLLNTTANNATTPTFAGKADFGTGANPVAVAVGDLNGDGKLDLAVADSGGATVSVILNTTAAGATSASFATDKTFGAGASPAAVAIADFDGDGKPDLAVTNGGATNTVSVLINTMAAGATTAAFTTKVAFTTGTTANGITVGDINRDGKPDIAVANQDDNTTSVLLDIAAATFVTAISLSQDHSCAIVNGGVQCWGNNANGQLGNNSIVHSNVPVQVSGLSGVTAISSGWAHTCALAGGGVWCWGDNSDGELGNNSNTESHVPVAVTGLSSGVLAIAAGWNHTCALVAGGLKCWGKDMSGQLGDNSGSGSLVPVAVTGLGAGSGVQTIEADYAHTSCVVGGAAKDWGYNFYGQLGDSATGGTSAVPVQVTGLTGGVTATADGSLHSCAIVNGAAKCWGFNQDGQLGNNSTGDSNAPVAVTGLGAGVLALTGGNYHTCAIVGGGVQCWGLDANGQLGNNSVSPSSVPVPVSGLTSAFVTAVSAGASDGCAIADGHVHCWGANGEGQLGNSSFTESHVPVAVTGL